MITTSLGNIQGLKITSVAANNFTYLSFRGIPYALPPVDDLRFKAGDFIISFASVYVGLRKYVHAQNYYTSMRSI